MSWIDLDKAGKLYPGHVVSLGVSPVAQYRHAWTASYQAHLRVKPSPLSEGWSVFGTFDGRIQALAIADHNRVPNAEECERLRKLWALIDWVPIAARTEAERSRMEQVNDARKAAHLGVLKAWDPFTQPFPGLTLEDPEPWAQTLTLPAPPKPEEPQPKPERPKRARTPVTFKLEARPGYRAAFRGGQDLPLRLHITSRLWVVPSRGKGFLANVDVTVDEENEAVYLWSECANQAIKADFEAWKGSVTAADVFPGVDLRKAYAAWRGRVSDAYACHLREAEKGKAPRNFDYPSGWLANLV